MGRKAASADQQHYQHYQTYVTKEFTMKTWPDFVRLFTQGGGWDFCACMHFQRPCSLPRNERLPTRAERGVRNRRQKKELLERGAAHGILVYADGEPVGWCAYGPKEEFPRIDNSRKHRDLAPNVRPERLWRIPCFVTHKKYRRKGVATAGLRAALEGIRKRGGGLVEGYPISRWLSRAFGNESTAGTTSMFAKAGFKKVAELGGTKFSDHVLMRRRI